ncbi:unnamed protein product [Onchocerca ochengi]|uniref:Protein kinase domain-containing protein n=1 Tax=Onchocerca ochengi TaxID=42157 RepID=A0A182EL76_ONCOC|nr:unnamed protein product [Onchocerca ochengi]
MSGRPDRSRLSLPLKNINARYDTEGANITSRPAQQKLIKSLSNPADYYVPTPANIRFPPSSSNSVKESRSCPPLSRAQSLSNSFSIRDTISNGTAKFFGVPSSENCQSSTGTPIDPKWSCRRLRFICKHYGNPKDIMMRELKQQNIPSVLDDLVDISSPSKSITPQSEVRETVFISSTVGTAETFSRSKSVESRGSRLTQQHLERRDSVMKIAYDRISAMIQRRTLRPKKACATVKRGRSVSGSFAPFSNQQTGNIAHIRIGPSAVDTFAANDMPTVVEIDFENHKMNRNKPKKQNEEEVEVSSFKKSRLTIHLPSEDASVVPVVKSEIQMQIPPEHEDGSAVLSSIDSIQDEVFFDYTSPTVSSSVSDTERGERMNPLHICRYQGLHRAGFPFLTKYKKPCSEDVPSKDGMGNLREEVGKMDGSPALKMQPACSKEQVRHRVRNLKQKGFDNSMEISIDFDHEKSTPFASLCNALSSPRVSLFYR